MRPLRRLRGAPSVAIAAFAVAATATAATAQQPQAENQSGAQGEAEALEQAERLAEDQLAAMGVEAMLAEGFTIMDIASDPQGDAIITLRRGARAAQCFVEMNTGDEICEITDAPAAGAPGVPAARLDALRPIVIDFLRENGCVLERSAETAALASAYFGARHVSEDESAAAAQTLLDEGVLTLDGATIVLVEGCEDE